MKTKLNYLILIFAVSQCTVINEIPEDTNTRDKGSGTATGKRAYEPIITMR